MMNWALSDEEIDEAVKKCLDPNEGWVYGDPGIAIGRAQVRKALWGLVDDMRNRFPSAAGKVDGQVVLICQYYHDKLVEMGVEAWENDGV